MHERTVVLESDYLEKAQSAATSRPETDTIDTRLTKRRATGQGQAENRPDSENPPNPLLKAGWFQSG